HRQVTPVESGILSFVFARALDRLDAHPGPFGAWDLTIDRVGPDPFDPDGLGPMITWRWPARLGGSSGSIRLWLPESILARLASTPPPPAETGPSHAALSSTWRCKAGTITVARGPSRLKPGGVLPVDGMALKGTVATPTGPLTLVCEDRDGRSWYEAAPVPNTSASRLMIATPLLREPTPREPLAVKPTPSQSAPADVPVTLVIELGRVNLTLSRLADLKPGDIVELGRHSREPVELTSNGKLVARGELVQIDTELGVRVTNVFL
ncbi:MAG TPA: FliM/FliN family flagellar motor switch protein, partial [Isosphaeraceae bacterium]